MVLLCVARAAQKQSVKAQIAILAITLQWCCAVALHGIANRNNNYQIVYVLVAIIISLQMNEVYFQVSETAVMFWAVTCGLLSSTLCFELCTYLKTVAARRQSTAEIVAFFTSEDACEKAVNVSAEKEALEDN